MLGLPKRTRKALLMFTDFGGRKSHRRKKRTGNTIR